MKDHVIKFVDGSFYKHPTAPGMNDFLTNCPDSATAFTKDDAETVASVLRGSETVKKSEVEK